jgi:hypothetical protein
MFKGLRSKCLTAKLSSTWETGGGHVKAPQGGISHRGQNRSQGFRPGLMFLIYSHANED